MTKRRGFWRASVAWKYYTSPRNRQRNALLFSAAGLALGLIIIIVVIGIMEGLQSGYIRDIIEVETYHTSIGPVSHETLEELTKETDQIPHADIVVPYGESQILIMKSGGGQVSIRLRGLDEQFQEDSGFRRHARILSGSFDIEGDSIVIGAELAYREGISVGQTIRAATVVPGRRVQAVPSARDLTVTGIFSTGYPDIDRTLGFTTIDTVKDMGIDRYYLGVKTDNLEGVSRYLETDEVFGEHEHTTWQQAYETFYAALMLEKYSMLIVLLLIFFVVAVNIRSSFERFLFEKREEIGILKTLGATSRDILAMLFYKGLFIAASAVIPGLLLGVLIAGNVNPILYGLNSAIRSIFGQGLGIEGIYFPVVISWPEIWISIGIMLLFIMLAVLRSARIINRFTPMEMFRYE